MATAFYIMRLVALTALAAVLAARPAAAQLPARSPDLAARADSLAALDPARELRRALARGDRRFVGVCGYACYAPGVDYGAPGAPRASQLRIVEGTSDHLFNQDVERLDAVAARYAERYNRLLLAHLRKRRSVSRPAT